METALKKASGNIPETLKGAGPFTVFAPDNGAFDKLAAETGFEDGADLVAKIDAELLAKILTYHVVAGKSKASDLTEGTKLTTLAGGELTLTVSVNDDEKIVQILDARKAPQTKPVINVTEADRNAGNGVVHIVNKILLSQKAIDALSIDTRPTILDYATGSEDLSILVEALSKAGLVETIGELKAANVLAPTNQAFADLLEGFGDDYNSLDDFDNPAEIAVLGNILKYHVLPTADLMAGATETAFEGNSVEVTAATGGFAFGDATTDDATTVTANIEAKNGFVQIIDKVLLPQSALDFLELLGSIDLATIVTRTPDLSVLEEALIATELVTTFVDATNESFVQGKDEKDEDFEKRRTPANFTYFKPATVFAPTNAAFESLLTELGDDYNSIADFDTEDELALLKEILLYHVVEGKVLSTDLSAGPVTTLAESDIAIINPAGTDTFVIGDADNNVNANIVSVDNLARNGVAHVIDRVLLPESAIAFINSLE